MSPSTTRITSTVHSKPDEGLVPLSVVEVVAVGVLSVVDWVAVAVALGVGVRVRVDISVAVGEREVVASVVIAVVVEGDREVAWSAAVDIVVAVDGAGVELTALVGLVAVEGVAVLVSNSVAPGEPPQPAISITQIKAITRNDCCIIGGYDRSKYNSKGLKITK